MAIKIHMLYTVQNVYKHVDNVDNLLAKELFSNIYNVSGPHSYQQVPFWAISSCRFAEEIPRLSVSLAA